MSFEPLPKRPYVEWTLDRWKIGVILLVFGGLLISSLANPVDEAVTSQAPVVQVTLPVGAALSPAGVRLNPTILPLLPENEGTPEPAATVTATGTPVPGVVQPTATATPPARGPSLPLTLANVSPNAIVAAGTVRALYGTGAPQSVIEVRDQAAAPVANTDLSRGAPQEQVLGQVTVDADGLWQLGPFDPLPPGQHVLTVFQFNALGDIEAVSSPVVVTVLESGEQGPLSLASPTIQFPTVGARLRSGPLTFIGSGLPGMGVRLFLDNRQVAAGMVSAREEWRLTPEAPLTPGVYMARVAAVNPQGEIIAESAPVVFRVEAAPASPSSALPLPTPSLPLMISSLVFGDQRRQSLVVRGRATPHAGVAAWVDDKPVRFANVLMDGGWQFWLFSDTELQGGEVVEIRSSLGERLVAETETAGPAPTAPPPAPVILSPKPGEVLTTRRPLVQGLAQPSSEVAVLVNSRLVARVLADRQGLWAYQLADPLPVGYSVLVAAVEGSWTTPDLKSRPVVVTLAPKL
jgi:hypothetical protein